MREIINVWVTRTYSDIVTLSDLQKDCHVINCWTSTGHLSLHLVRGNVSGRIDWKEVGVDEDWGEQID